MSFREALLNHFEIKTPTKDLIKQVAQNSQDSDLLNIIEDKEALSNFLWGRDLIDFLAHYKHGLNAQSLISLLKKLQARAYSISSSPKKHPGEVHLTVGSVRYGGIGTLLCPLWGGPLKCPNSSKQASCRAAGLANVRILKKIPRAGPRSSQPGPIEFGTGNCPK